jgi:hypothetical protein
LFQLLMDQFGAEREDADAIAADELKIQMAALEL